MTRVFVGRPVSEALSSLPAGYAAPRIVETAAPARPGQQGREGTLRVVACREGVWIAARFQDGEPRGREADEGLPGHQQAKGKEEA